MKHPGPTRYALTAVAAAALVSCDAGTAPVPAPDAPASVTAEPVSHTEVVLTWTPPPDAPDDVEFRVERARGDGPFAVVATLPGDVLTFRDTGLDPGAVYVYRVRTCGPGGCSSSATVTTVTTFALLEITTASLPDAVRDEAYNAGLAAVGGSDGYIWTLLAGSLPAGLALSERGIISGIPGTEQSATFTVRVRSDDGQTASTELTIRVVAEQAGTAVSIQTTRLPPALAGGTWAVSLQATGGSDGAFTWTVVSGALPPGVTLGSGGTFSGAPTATGVFNFTARAESGGQTDEQGYTMTVVPNDQSAYNVTRFDVATVPAGIGPHVEAAIARWERVVRGNLAAGHIPPGFFSSTFCGGFGSLINGTSVDDVIVMVDITPLDGPGRILGQAGPCGLRGSGLPFAGTLTLDADDLEPLVGTQALTDLVFHEIGHILGFGGLWDSVGLMTGAGTADPRFTGSGAVQQWRSLGGSGNVPIESMGGEGTRDSHWRESVFDSEIMTGFSERVGAQPLSRVTIASLADLGYTVDLGAADPYVLPAPPPTPGAAREDSPGWDVVLAGPVRVLPTGEEESGAGR